MTDVLAFIARAESSPELRARAKAIFARNAPTMFPEYGRRPDVMPSDYGSCSLALWAAFHGLEDMARDPLDEQLARLDLGTLTGAWLAALLKASAESDGWTVALEDEPGRGHIDAFMARSRRHGAGPKRVIVEFKSAWQGATMAPQTIDKASRAHVLQAADYALQANAGEVVLVYFAPAAKAGKRLSQIAFDPHEYGAAVDAEEERLRRARVDVAPLADPQFAWSCHTCRYSACERNVRGQKAAAAATEAAELDAATTAIFEAIA